MKFPSSRMAASGSGPGSRRGWTPTQLVVVALLLITGGIIGWHLRVPGLASVGDDADYLSLSQSLAHGRYRDEFLVGTPRHAHYPPGMALLLLAVWTLGGGIRAAQGLHLVLLGVTALLLGTTLRRLGHAWLGVGLVGLVVLNPTLLVLTGTLLSETLFTTLSMIAVVALHRAGESEGGAMNRWIGLALGVAMAAFLTRTVGVAVLATVVVVLALRRQWRWMAGATLASAVVTGGWFMYVRVAARGTPGGSYVADLAVRREGSVVSVWGGRIVDNARFYIRDGMPDALGLAMIPGHALDNLLWTLLLVGTGVAGVWWLRARWPAVPAVLLATVGILCLWPWGLVRLAAPLIPLGLVAILSGTVWVAASWPHRRLAQWIAPMVVAGLVGSAVWTDARLLAATDACPRFVALSDRPACTAVVDDPLVATARAAAMALPESAVVATAKPAVVHAITGLATAPLALFSRPINRADDLFHRTGVTHLLLAGSRPVELAGAAPALLRVCQELTEAVALDIGRAAILRLRPPGEPDACDVLRRLAAIPPETH